MSDPLAGYFEKAPASTAVVEPAQDPLAGYFGTSSEPSGPDLETAVGRRDANIQNLQDNIARLQAIKPANAAHKARIDKLIASYQAQLPSFGGFVPGTEDTSAPAAKDALAGFFGGVTQGLMGGAALAGAAIAPAGKGPFGGLSRQVEEASQQITEDTNPQGKTGAVGALIGNLVGGTVPYGTAAELGAEQIAKAAPKSFVAKAVKASAEGTAGVGQRVAKNLVGGVPINVVLAAGQPVTGDPEHDLAARAKQFGIGTMADILFGMLPTKGKAADETPAEPATAGTPPAGQVAPERTQAFLDIQAKRQAREAAAAYDKLAKTQARAEWQVANSGKKWNDLIPDDRKTLVSQWKERHPTTDTSQPSAAEQPTPEQQAAIDQGPQPVQNPAEVAAVVTQVQQALEAKGASPDQAVAAMKELQAAADRRNAARPSDAVVWTTEDRARYITDRQKAYAAKINKPWSQWTPSEKAGYVADQMAVRKELEATRVPAPPAEVPSAAPEGASGETPVAPKDLSGVPAEIPGDNFDELVKQVQAKGGLTSPEELAAFNEELIKIHEKPLSEAEHASEVQQLVEDFSPLDHTQSEGNAGADVPRLPGNEPARVGSAESQPSAETARGESPAAPKSLKERSDEAISQHRIKTEDEFELGRAQMHDMINASKDLKGTELHKALDEVYILQSELGDFIRRTNRPSEISRLTERLKKLGEANRAVVDNLVGSETASEPVAAPEGQSPKIIPEEPSPQSGTQNATRSSVTRLESIDTKPLEEMSPRKIETTTDRVLQMLDSAKEGTPEYEALHRDLEKLLVAERRSEGSNPLVAGAQAPLPEGAIARPAVPVGVTGADFVTRVAEAPVESLDPKLARKLFQANLKKMSPEDLNAHIEDMQSRVSVLGKDEGAPYRERLDKALEERAERFQSQAGIRLQIPPAAGGFTAGFIGGFLTSDDDTDRLTNALMWGAVGAAAGYAGGKFFYRGGESIVKPRSVAELPGGAWQEEIHKHVVTDYDRGKTPASLREKLRQIYTGIVRRSLTAERFMQSVGASRLGTERNAAKLLAMYGRWTGQTESALKYGPALFDEFGNYKKLDALGIDDILNIVGGDVETLGDLMAARTKVEMGDAIKTPFDTVAAEKMFYSVPEKFHQAADEMRKFSLAMAEVLVDGGVLSKDALEKFKMETMYATLQRVFKMDSKFSTSAEAKQSAVVGASSPLKARKGGSTTDIKNPVEATIASVPWYYRAAEQNKIKHGLVEAWEAAGSPSALMKRVSKTEVKMTADQEAKIASLQAEIKGLDSENAHALVAGLDPSSIDPLEGTMRVYRNGNVESYKMPKELALALQTMNSEDLGMLTKVLGAPARLATKGITYNPFFLAKMAWFDMWQATLNSQYGFRFGLDNMRGWLHQVTQSKKYQELLGVGFAHQSFAVSKESFSTKLSSISANKGSPYEVAIKQIKEMKPIEAYKTLVAPLGDAARVGEALRALDHGASTIEAAYAGKQVTANYGEVGQFAQMRALNHVIMFLNPAMQVMDQAFYRMGVHPFRVSEEGRAADMVRYGTKAFASITIPSMLLWAKYHDDEKITQYRQTDTGSRYWWMRSPVTVPGVVDQGEIIKLPKPIFDGHVWGTSMEAALDNMKAKDPQSVGAVASALLRDAAFNILPTVGEIPYSLQANQDLSWGGHIIPTADDQLALEHQGEDRASWISREISKKIAPLAQDSESQMLRNAVTPAGLDYIIRNVGGMLGQDAVTAVSQAMEAQTKGYVPAKEEYPLIRNVIVDDPNTKTRDIEQFYQRLGKVQTVGATIDHLAKEDPEKLARYMVDNQADYMLVNSFSQARQSIANYRRAIVDIKNMDGKDVSSDDRRQITKTFINLIQQSASTAMLQAKEIDKALVAK